MGKRRGTHNIIYLTVIEEGDILQIGLIKGNLPYFWDLTNKSLKQAGEEIIEVLKDTGTKGAYRIICSDLYETILRLKKFVPHIERKDIPQNVIDIGTLGYWELGKYDLYEMAKVLGVEDCPDDPSLLGTEPLPLDALLEVQLLRRVMEVLEEGYRGLI